MALDSTTIKDQRGSAIYFIHDGSEMDERNFGGLVEAVSQRTQKQCLLMGPDDPNAQKIVEFYQLKGSHFVVIVRDDDTLHHVWSDGENFDPSNIAYLAEQAG